MKDKQQYWSECIRDGSALIIDFRNTEHRIEYFRVGEQHIPFMPSTPAEYDRAIIELSPEGVTKLLEVAQWVKAAREQGTPMREPTE